MGGKKIPAAETTRSEIVKSGYNPPPTETATRKPTPPAPPPKDETGDIEQSGEEVIEVPGE